MKTQIKALLHCAYWAFYLATLVLIVLVAQVGQPAQAPYTYIVTLSFFFMILPSVLGFYFSYFFLFSQYLKHRKIGQLFGFGLVAVLLIALMNSGLISIYYGRSFMFKDGYTSYFSELSILVLVGIVHTVTGFILQGFVSWYADLKTKEILQKSTDRMELELIKSRLDPHFLFNSLNNIDGLMRKDVEIASDYLDKLASMLRFLLYESKEEKIEIERELIYIQQYIDLQKIRTTNANFISYKVTGTQFKHLIPPMLFTPFIENAVKHLASKKVFNAIEISIAIEKESVTFFCKNAYKKNAHSPSKSSGIGNELIEKRLQIFYPNQHQLERIITDDSYTVQVTIFVLQQNT